jgi:pyrroline-5-carboxylate reductase
MKYGFAGTGNMAGAIIRGAIASGKIPADHIYCTNTNTEKLAAFAHETGVQICSGSKELAETVDVLVVSVKPHVVKRVLTDAREAIVRRRVLVLSIAANVSAENLAEYLGPENNCAIVRIMPNVNALVGAGVTALHPNEHANDAQYAVAEGLFSSVGICVRVAEEDFNAFTAIASCSPAFSFMYIDALARAGVKNGLHMDKALKIAAQAVLGSAKLLLESGKDPWTMVDQVCSPGGTTIAGVYSLQESAFPGAVMRAVEESIRRGDEVAKKV